MYHIIDTKTGKTVKEYATRKQASRQAEKMDLAYGAVRYVVRWID